MGLFNLNLFLEFFNRQMSIYQFGGFLLGNILFFKFYYEALSNLLYTFWGLTIFLAVNLFIFYFSSLSTNAYSLHGSVTFLMLILHGVIIYLASSPVYYPRVSWWEFDYRYRSEIKINTIFEENENEGRLNDLRRGGGSISSFDEFPLGSIIQLHFDFRFESYDFKAVVGSASRSIPGRPCSYGIKFLLESEEDNKAYKLLLLNWRTRSKVKLDEKFQKDKTI